MAGLAVLVLRIQEDRGEGGGGLLGRIRRRCAAENDVVAPPPLPEEDLAEGELVLDVDAGNLRDGTEGWESGLG